MPWMPERCWSQPAYFSGSLEQHYQKNYQKTLQCYQRTTPETNLTTLISTLEMLISRAKTAIREIEFELDYEQQHLRNNMGVDYSDNPIGTMALIDGMEGHQFEYYCADLLRKNGFSSVSVTPGSGDQGVDILATKEGVKYAIQCKNYSSPLSNTPVQEVYAGKTFYHCHVGVVMTNSTFTEGAVSLANTIGVLLWGRDTLQRMMKG